MSKHTPSSIGNIFNISEFAEKRPKLLRTNTIKEGDNPNSAFMNLKARKFRDILLSDEHAVILWDKAVGWLLCVCIQNEPFLRKVLLTKKIKTFSYTHSGSVTDGTRTVQLFEREQEMILSIILGGAGYRGITNFISSGLENKDFNIENFAPRSHDFDISFGLKNYKRDIYEVINTILQLLILFSNMMFNELEEKCFNYWTEQHSDSLDMPIQFIKVADAPHEGSREKVLWTHESGLIQISMLKSSKYTNIRTNVAIQYIDEKKNVVKELDHIVELVFWDIEAPVGTATLLKKSMTSDIINILAYYEDDVILNTKNNNVNSYPAPPYFTGNAGNYYNSENYKYPDNDIIFDDDINKLYYTNNSPYTKFFNEENVNMVYCPILRLDKLGEATFEGLIGRSRGHVAAKCRQDYSRLYYTLTAINVWNEFKNTQGDIDELKTKLDNLTKPTLWKEVGQSGTKKYVDGIIESKNYSDTNYVQCRTFDENGSQLKRLADAKFHCYTNDDCLAQSTEESNKQPTERHNGENFGYEANGGPKGHGGPNGIDYVPNARDYGYYEDVPNARDYGYDEDVFKENIPIDNLSMHDIELYDQKKIIDEWGYEIINDGCLFNYINGTIFYNPNLYINEDQLKKLNNILQMKLRTYRDSLPDRDGDGDGDRDILSDRIGGNNFLSYDSRTDDKKTHKALKRELHKKKTKRSNHKKRFTKNKNL
jgi:hypothetical protein